MIPKRQAQALRRLLQRRLAAFEQRLRAGEENGAGPSAAELERQAKALMALMKALQAAADMEKASAATSRHKHEQSDDAAIRRRLARQLEALCAQTQPPRAGGGAG